MNELRRIVGYMRPYLGQMAAASVMLAIAGAMMTLVVATLEPMVNEVLLTRPAQEAASAPDEDPNFVDSLVERLPIEETKMWLRERPMVKVPVLLVLVFLIRGILLYFGEYLARKTGSAVIRDLRADVHDTLVYQAPSFFRAHHTGEVLSRLLNDVHLIKLMSTRLLADTVRVGAMGPAMLILVLIYDWRMTLFALIVLPVMGYPVVRLGKRLRKAATRSQEQTATAANQLKESVAGSKVIQAFSMEEIAVRRFRKTLASLFQVDLQASRAASASGPIVELVGAIGGSVLFYVAGRGIAAGTVNPGNFVVVLGGLAFLFMSARRLNQINVEAQQALAAANRVFTMMDWPLEIADRPDARSLEAEPQEIHFENVVYSYPDSEEAAIKGIDLHLRRGEMVALVGPSGGGKTTLANLMLRFADPTSGKVTMDGIDLRELELASVRGNIGLVTQETILFDDTVRLNIAAGREGSSLEDVREAAIAAQADEFVRDLPDGYDTMLGEDGARLSMGQRQRLTIARAFFKNPPFLVLDEATSALDAESEDKVQQAMKVLLEGRGSLVIAHRLATIREADRIVVLENGLIVEEGTHQALLELDGLYAHLHELQFQES
ncbi:MAG: ABC transporter ATP-binding protein/permease [Thermoanaerobaculales bacterium]|nr:ABC transporter ATP-binding protein/permease [Thermoanaerobaculales bacterium]